MVSERIARLFRHGRRMARTLLTVLVLAPLAASCYMPDDFLTEIRISKTGDYALVYKGKLVWVPLYKDIVTGALKDVTAVKEKEGAILRDLQRDDSFKKVQAVGRGTFDVFYERLGRFTGTSQVSFPRRGMEILRMEVRKNGVLYVVAATGAKPGAREELQALGLTPNGKIRIMTDATVIKTNAQNKSAGIPGYPGWVVYDWTVNGPNQPAPIVHIQMFPPTAAAPEK